jgi:hypothetical protein
MARADKFSEERKEQIAKIKAKKLVRRKRKQKANRK